MCSLSTSSLSAEHLVSHFFQLEFSLMQLFLGRRPLFNQSVSLSGHLLAPCIDFRLLASHLSIQSHMYAHSRPTQEWKYRNYYDKNTRQLNLLGIKLWAPIRPKIFVTGILNRLALIALHNLTLFRTRIQTWALMSHESASQPGPVCTVVYSLWAKLLNWWDKHVLAFTFG